MTPQKAAGRIVEPPVWVPSPTGTWKSATAAAEPLDEPPGVCAGLCGWTVSRGSRLANSVVTVLPRMTPAGGADQRDAGGVGKGPVAAVDRRAVLGRHVDRVDDVLDPDRNPGQQARPPGPVGRARLGQRLLRIEPRPGLDLGTGTDPLQAIADQSLGGQRAGGKARRCLAGGQALGAAHGRSPCSSRRSTQSPTSSSRASSCRQPTSWMPTGNPSGPCPAGKVKHGI